MEIDGITDSNLVDSLFGSGKTWEVDDEEIKDGPVERRKRVQKGGVKIGMMRNMMIIMDMSKAMLQNDLSPNRHHLCTVLLEKFIEEFFDRNPIAQIGILITRNKRCEKIIDMCGNSKKLLSEMKKVQTMSCEGEASLYNSLEQAVKGLKNVPRHISKEVLVVFAAISTIDPHKLMQVVEQLKTSNIKCSIIGLSASLFVCQKICKETQGRYEVVMDEFHFRSIMEDHLIPPVSLTNQDSSLVKMGFPELDSNPRVVALPCECNTDDPKHPTNQPGYQCPQCSSKYCELPIDCVVCNLTLASSAHLARSYHHLFPLQPFIEIPSENTTFCYACQTPLVNPASFQCNQCLSIFCSECDAIAHDNLHFCPSCSTISTNDT